jgi:hypothetical protein
MNGLLHRDEQPPNPRFSRRCAPPLNRETVRRTVNGYDV